MHTFFLIVIMCNFNILECLPAGINNYNNTCVTSQKIVELFTINTFYIEKLKLFIKVIF